MSDKILIDGCGHVVGKQPTTGEVELLVSFLEGKPLSEMPENFEEYLRQEVLTMVKIMEADHADMEKVAVALEAVGNADLNEIGNTEWDIAYTTGLAHGKLMAASIVGLMLNQAQVRIMTTDENVGVKNAEPG